MIAALSHRVGDATPANFANGAVAALGLRPRVRAFRKPVTTSTDVHVQNMCNAAVAGAQVLCVCVGIMDDHASNSFSTADLSGGGGGGRGGGMKNICDRRGSETGGQQARQILAIMLTSVSYDALKPTAGTPK